MFSVIAIGTDGLLSEINTFNDEDRAAAEEKFVELAVFYGSSNEEAEVLVEEGMYIAPCGASVFIAEHELVKVAS